MLVLLIILLTIIGLAVLVGLMEIIEDARYKHTTRLAERARIDAELRRAERQVHDIARRGLQAMLDEARIQRGARSE